MSDAAGGRLFSISELAQLTTLDRATVSKRLKEIEPQGGARNAKTYSLEVALPALIAGASAEYDEARTRKMQADADLREHELAVERAEYLPMKEVRDYALLLFKAMHGRLAVQLPRRVAPALHKAGSPELIAEMLEKEVGRDFNDLRRDHTSLL